MELGSCRYSISAGHGWSHSRACGQLLVRWVALFLGVGWLSAGPYRMPLLPQDAHLDLLTCISRLPKPQKQMLQSVSRPGLKTHAMHSPHILGQTSRGPDQAMGHSRPKGGQETPLHGRSWKALWPFSQLTIENSATRTSARVVADPRR